MELIPSTDKTIISGGDMVASEMGISQKNSAMAAYYLRDKIYEDKVLAVVREYITNALDEHHKHNIDKPVEVRLYREGDNYIFSVRDYALGLDQDGIRNVFGMLFESTKSGSNDDMGGFGIGSKSAHAYTDDFTIISHHNGEKTTYFCPLETSKEHKVPIGVIYNLSSEPTKETGLEILVTVKSGDKYNFVQTISRVIRCCRSETKIEGVLADVQGVIKPIGFKTVEEEDGFTFSVLGSALDKGGNTLYHNGVYGHQIRMGDICYSCPNWLVSLLGTLSVQEMIIDVPVGFFSLALSREAIEDTDHNRKNGNKIIGAVKKIKDRVFGDQKIEIKDLLSYGHSMKISLFTANIKDYGYPFTTLSAALRHLIYNDESLKKAKNIYVVLIPSNSARDGWIHKLITWAQKDTDNLYFYFTSYHEDITKEQKDKILELDSRVQYYHVKALKRKLLKDGLVEAQKKSSPISQEYRYCPPDNNFTKKGIISSVVEGHFGCEIKKFKVPSLKKIDSIEELLKYTVRKVTNFGWDNRSSCWRVSAQKAYDAFISLGFYAYDDEEVRVLREKLNKKREKNNEFRRKRDSFFYNGFGYYRPDPAAKKRCNLKGLNKIEKLLKSIANENSPRGQVIKCIDGSYGQKIDRQTLRKILKLT